MCFIIMCEKYQGGKFMKKLWYCVGGEYHKKILRNARNFSFWPTQIINLVDKNQIYFVQNVS